MKPTAAHLAVIYKVPDHNRVNRSPGPVMQTQSKRAAIVAVTFALPTLSALAVSLRLYTRLHILKVTGPDDWVIIVALVWALRLHSHKRRVQANCYVASGHRHFC